jgi:hypothetical protein
MKKFLFFFCLFLLALPYSHADNGGKKGKKNKAKKQSALGVYEGYHEQQFQHKSYLGQYVPMHDGVKLAIDVFSPRSDKSPKKQAEIQRRPTLVYFVRYCRTLDLKPFFRFMGNPFFGHVRKDEVNFFTQNGYNCVIVDLRGSGASFGFRTMEFSPQEVEDMATVLDWVVAQPWSDGQTATTGVSYTGTTAEFALTTKHPSLKACIPRSAIFDLYTDMNFPGGIRQTPFIEIWKTTTQALDRNDLSVFGGKAKLAVRGIMPINYQYDSLYKAVSEHKQNFDIFAGLYRIETRDDIDPVSKLSVDGFSVHNHIRTISETKVPIYRISGWYDGGNISSAIKGFWNTPNTEKLLIGAWDHGPEQHISPFAYEKKTKFNVFAEMLRFLDFHLMGIQNGIDQQPKVAYFEMGKEQFMQAEQFPPLSVQNTTYFLDSENRLKATQNNTSQTAAGHSDYAPTLPLLGTGGGSRWNCLTPLYRYSKEIGYPDRKAANARMLVFTAPPVLEATSIVGQPQITLHFSNDTTDAHIFVYLEDVAPNGDVTYITEGQMRAIYRAEKADTSHYRQTAMGVGHSFSRADLLPLSPQNPNLLRFELLATAYQLPKGHSLRVSIATSDIDHFDTPISLAIKPLRVYHDAVYRSSISIPIAK